MPDARSFKTATTLTTLAVACAMVACGDPARTSDYSPEDIYPTLELIANADTGVTQARLKVTSGGPEPEPGSVFVVPFGSNSLRLTNSDHFSLTRGNSTEVLYRRAKPFLYEAQFDGAGKQSYSLKFNRRGQPEDPRLTRVYAMPATPILTGSFSGAQLAATDTIEFSWQPGDSTESLTSISLKPSVTSCTTVTGAVLDQTNTFGTDRLEPLPLDQSRPEVASGTSISTQLDTLFSSFALEQKNIVSCEAQLQIAVAIDKLIENLSTSIRFTLLGSGV